MSEMIFSAYIPTKLIFGTGEVAKLAETPLPGKKSTCSDFGGYVDAQVRLS